MHRLRFAFGVSKRWTCCSPNCWLLISCWMALSIATASAAENEASQVASTFFEQHIRPTLAQHCIKCHGPAKQEGELRLDSLAGMLNGGESGAAIVPGDPAESRLISAIRHDDLEMPPDGRLPEQTIQNFALWIQSGAGWPDHAQEIRETAAYITDQDRQWWAFQPISDPPPPQVDAVPGTDPPGVTDIDRFVRARLDRADMQPAAPANRATLARRLYLNLIGLPPTPRELDEFVNDTSSSAYENLVDTLLADQRHGEHWARFWLDLVRYAESDGWKADSYRPDIWRYRDYVVNSFNNDRPWPEFVMQQLAGDEQPNPDPETLAATGYLRLGIFEYNQRNSRQHWDDILNEITDVTGDVFLGIGMACARCHDHKFDPILQVDYFKLRAFFEPIVFNDDFVYATDEEIADHQQRLNKWEHDTRDVRERIDALLKPYHDRKWKATVDKFPLEIQDSFHKPAAQKNSWDQQMTYFVGRQFYEEGGGPLKSMKSADEKVHEKLKQELAQFDELRPEPLPSLMSAANFPGPAAETRIPDRDDMGPVAPGFARVLSHVCGPEYPECGTQRRSALADWITSPDNPVTTRVLVNRIWKQHFGRGLVESVSDFGNLGGQPTHPQLLDWLASRFVEDGWSLKQLHKRIVMSATWQQSAGHPHAARYSQRDPQNHLLWRREVTRLTAEQIRDAMLHASGELDNRMGGPSENGSSRRRSLYVKSFRNSPDRFLHSFDIANGLKSVGQRNSTTTPTQALMMINGSFTLERAQKMARRLGSLKDDRQRVQRATLLAWGRSPTADELQTSLGFVASNSTEEEFDNLADYCHVLLNSNEFLYVD